MRCYSCRKYDNCELPWKCSSTMYDCSAYELEQTNEEWLKQCTAEQLAECIIGVDYGADDKDTKIAKLVEWLNQPHTFE